MIINDLNNQVVRINDFNTNYITLILDNQYVIRLNLN